jgi:hypothetical protein
LMYSLKTLKIASSFFMFFSIKHFFFEIFSCFCNDCIQCSQLEQFELEPTALNSNLFPVKANGEVLFLSVLSKERLNFTYDI